MAEQQPVANEEDVAKYEQELAGYLQERIKPGLNSGAIPLLARSIAKDLAQQVYAANGAAEKAEAADAPAQDEGGAEKERQPDFEDEMRDLQSDLGEDWILRFSVKGDDAWLTAEKADGSQRVEAPTAAVLIQAVELLNEGGGRSA
jgi:hypothetical protein